MAKTDLLKEAIADAKAVRETALANAKIALEEAFTPRIQSMLSAKLSEEEADDTDMTDDMPVDTAMDEGEHEDAKETNGDGMDTAAGAPVDEGEHEDDKMDEGEHEEDGMDEDLELEAILKELEEGEDDDKMDEGEDDDKMDEQSGSSDIGKGDNKVDVADGSDEEDPGKGKLVAETKDEKDDMDEDVDLDEIIEALREGEDDDKVDEGEHGDDEKNENYTAGVDDGAAAKDLEEAYNVIRFLKSKINEVNLLNAKLLFSNKLFRNHSLNESQKMKVIENFDRAQSLREVKLVFATLSESFVMNGQKTKRTIKESYASKPSKSTAPKKEVISEGNQLAARWKKLANL